MRDEWWMVQSRFPARLAACFDNNKAAQLHTTHLSPLHIPSVISQCAHATGVPLKAGDSPNCRHEWDCASLCTGQPFSSTPCPQVPLMIVIADAQLQQLQHHNCTTTAQHHSCCGSYCTTLLSTPAGFR